MKYIICISLLLFMTSCDDKTETKKVHIKSALAEKSHPKPDCEIKKITLFYAQDHFVNQICLDIAVREETLFKKITKKDVSFYLKNANETCYIYNYYEIDNDRHLNICVYLDDLNCKFIQNYIRILNEKMYPEKHVIEFLSKLDFCIDDCEYTIDFTDTEYYIQKRDKEFKRII